MLLLLASEDPGKCETNSNNINLSIDPESHSIANQEFLRTVHARTKQISGYYLCASWTGFHLIYRG